MQKLLIFFTVLIGLDAFSQKVPVSGYIILPDGNPAYQASVIVKTGKGGTWTNEKGYFYIEVNKRDSLRISRVSSPKFFYGVRSAAVIEIELDQTPDIMFDSRGYVNDLRGGRLVKELLSDKIIPTSVVDSNAGGVEGKERIYTLVEIPANSKLSASDLAKAITNGVNTSGGKSNGELHFLIRINKSGWVDSVAVIKTYKTSIDLQIAQRLREINFFPALQNGKAMESYAILRFGVKKEKKKLLLTVNPEL